MYYSQDMDYMWKLLVCLPTSLLLALGVNSYNHRNYYNTIYKVQTIDFNMLASSLPTKLSLALRNNDKKEIQRTINSNYGYFGIVVTNCLESKKECPLQNITAISQPEKSGWKEKVIKSQLANYQYDLLRKSLPKTAEIEFKNPRATKPQRTGRLNTGKIIGRVYYIRRDPIDFFNSQKEWISQPFKAMQTLIVNGQVDFAGKELNLFFDNGVNNLYVLTYGGGLLLGLFVEQIWRSSSQKRKALEQDIKLLNDENKKLNNKFSLLQPIIEKLKNEKLLIEEEVIKVRDDLKERQNIEDNYQKEIEKKESNLRDIHAELLDKQSTLDLDRQKYQDIHLNEEDNLCELEQQIAVLSEREEVLKKILDEYHDNATEYRKEVSLKERELKKVNTDLDRTKSQLVQAEIKIGVIQNQQQINEDLLSNSRLKQLEISQLEIKLKDYRKELEKYIEEFDIENESLQHKNIILNSENEELKLKIGEYTKTVTKLENVCDNLKKEIANHKSSTLPSTIDLSSYKIAIVGGHPNTRRRVAERLHRHGLPSGQLIEIPPSDEHGSSQQSVKNKIINCNLVAIITSYIGHDLTDIVSNLKDSGAINGYVLQIHFNGAETISDKIIEHINSYHLN